VQVRHLVDLILNCYQQRYRSRRRLAAQQNGGAEGGMIVPKLEDVKEEDTKEDIKGEGSGELVECETLLTVEKVRVSDIAHCGESTGTGKSHCSL
jgi:hypothetical protein